MIEWRRFDLGTLAEGVRASPYYEWAAATCFAYYGPSAWLPMLLELRDSPLRLGSAEAFADFVLGWQLQPEKAPAWVKEVRVPAFYASSRSRLKPPCPFIALLVTPTFVDMIGADPQLAQCILQFELGAPTFFDDNAPPDRQGPASPLAAELASARVLMAVVDDGMAFAHDRFAGADGSTRIEFAFDQRWPLAPWFFGREVGKRDALKGIDKCMADSRHAGIVDEDEVYRRTAFLDLAAPGHKPLLACASHGAAVADLACGSAVAPAAGERPLVMVQLPTATVADTSGATLGPQVMAALRYIVWRADGIDLALPVVVNLSYGTHAGPHDGSSLFERAMDRFLEACGSSVRLVLPAGNGYLSRCHARFSLEGHTLCRRLHWRVLPDDRTENRLEIWLPTGAPNLQLEVTAPDGTPTTPLGWGSGQRLYLDGHEVGRASYYAPGKVGQRAMVSIILAPTADPAGVLPRAPAGLWCIDVSRRPEDPAVLGIHAWIQRDDTAPGYPRAGRPSYFDDPHYARFDVGGRPIGDDTHPDTSASYVQREGTLNAIATGKEPIVVGGFRRSDGGVAAYSASGPLVGAGRGAPSPHGPDALLPSEEAPALPGLIAAGLRSASVAVLQGTSAAAPLAARWLADRAAAGRENDRQAIFDAAQQADTDPHKPPESRGGGGRLPQATPGRRPRRDGVP